MKDLLTGQHWLYKQIGFSLTWLSLLGGSLYIFTLTPGGLGYLAFIFMSIFLAVILPNPFNEGTKLAIISISCIVILAAFPIILFSGGNIYKHYSYQSKYGISEVLINNPTEIMLTDGAISYLTAYQVLTNIQDKTTTLLVTGPGGSTGAAQLIVDAARENNLKVVAYGKLCASACTLIWAGSNQPDIDSSYPVFGFHGSSSFGIRSVSIDHIYESTFIPEIIDYLMYPYGEEEMCHFSSSEVKKLMVMKSLDNHPKAKSVLHQRCYADINKHRAQS